jgi:hypothetical protein
MSPDLLGTIPSSFLVKSFLKINGKCSWASSLYTSLLHLYQKSMEKLLEFPG